MGVLDFLKGKTIEAVGSVVDELSTSDEEKLNVKNKLTEITLSGLNGVIDAQKEVLVTEMQGNFLQRSWRPILMLTFGVILVCKWFGFTDATIENELELKLMDIIELGLGGYVVGRSVEKVAGTVTKNIDMSFLKKKDRKL